MSMGDEVGYGAGIAPHPNVWGSDQFWAEFVQPGRTCKPCVARGVVI